MIIIASKQLPSEAIATLKKFGKVQLFETRGIVSPPLSCHPDLFVCQVFNNSILAPNVPLEIIQLLDKNEIYYQKGYTDVGLKHPQTAIYNAVCTSVYCIHSFKISDTSIIENTKGIEKIDVTQAYCRCTTIAVSDNSFITSDSHIKRKLVAAGADVFLFESSDILLPGYSKGFIGGCCGFADNKLFICGSLAGYSENLNLMQFLHVKQIEIIELYSGKLFDGGGILFFS